MSESKASREHDSQILHNRHGKLLCRIELTHFDGLEQRLGLECGRFVLSFPNASLTPTNDEIGPLNGTPVLSIYVSGRNVDSRRVIRLERASISDVPCCAEADHELQALPTSSAVFRSVDALFAAFIELGFRAQPSGRQLAS